MSTVKRIGDMAEIRIPIEDVHTLRVCLHACPCNAPKSNATADYAKRLDKALARLEAGK